MPKTKPDIKPNRSTSTPKRPTSLFLCTNLLALLSATISACNLGRQYPLMREFFLIFLASEAISFCYLLLLGVRSRGHKNGNYISQCLTDWLTAKGQQKLLATRAFFLLVLIFLLTARPDFFKANIMMLIGIVVILVLLIFRAADVLERRQDTKEAGFAVHGKTSPQAGQEDPAAPVPKKHMKTRTKTAIAIAAFLLYVILGVLISGFPQPKISDGYKENFHPEAFYGSEPNDSPMNPETTANPTAGNNALVGTVTSANTTTNAISTAGNNAMASTATFANTTTNAISTAGNNAMASTPTSATDTGPDRAVILEDNSEALIERVRMIQNAKERVILSTFDFRTDISGKVLLAALLDAAERGVCVKVVVDGVSGLLRMEQNPYFFALSSHKNAEIRIYNRVNPLLPWRLMGRLHDKYLIADETAYILGGRNSFSYFLGDWPGHKNYDRDVLVYNAGGEDTSSLYQVEAYFNEIWNLEYTTTFHNAESIGKRTCVKRAAAELKELYAQYLIDYPAAKKPADYKAMTFPTGKITLLANPTTPYAKEPTVFYALTELMKQAKQSVTIHTPYIIANDLMYDAFAEIAAAVPDVNMMTNSVANNGNPFGAGDYKANFDKIHATGIKLLEYEGGVSYHGKSIVIDDNLSAVGSFNMDMRSVYLDTELMLVIDSKEVNAQLRGLLSRYEDECAIVQPDKTRIFPAGVTPQEISAKKKFNINVLYNLLRWARRLL